MDGHQHIQLALPCPGSSATSMSPLLTEARGANMCPALYRTVCRGRTKEVMERLQQQHGAAADDQATGIMQHGQCDILELSAEGNTVYHVAAEQGHSDLIRELYLKFKEKRDLLTRRNVALDTPLHCAARAGHVKAVAVLIELYPECGEHNLDCKNEAGDTALHLAARHGHEKEVEALVTASPAAAGELNNAGVSPLYLAVMSGSEKAVRDIVTHCRDASCAGPSSQNALHAAVFQSSKMLELLLKWRPALADEVDCKGSSPLHFASSDGQRSVVRAILLGAPPTTVYKRDAGGLSALHVAAQMGHDRVVKELLERFPDAAELRDNGGGTFLHAAAKEKRSSVVSLVVKNNRCSFRTPVQRGLLNAQDMEGNTPLHLAVAAGAPRVVDTLLRKGKVRADVLNNAGNTAFDLVSESTSYFTMVSLVVTLVAFNAQPRPQRQDHLKPWSYNGIVQGIEKTSDSLTVVAVLIATAAFAAGFNLPGGYGENDGLAKLDIVPAFKCFLFFDTIAAVTSVVAALLLVYGKASCSAGSWTSFVASLHFLWVSLISLMLAFYAALVAVASTKSRVYDYVLQAINFCIYFLIIWIATKIGPAAKSSVTNLRFLWQSCCWKGRNAIKRQYPLAGACIPNLFLFEIMNFIASIGFLVLYDMWLRGKRGNE